MLLEFPLTEEIKWNKPCYSFEGRNVVVLLPLKNYLAALFCKGSLLNNEHGFLVQAGENSQAQRQFRFSNPGQLRERAATFKACLREAIAVEKNGRQVVYKKITEQAVPDELRRRLDESPELERAFHALTPGRQRAYLLYFSGAKQVATREARVEKYRQQILDGIGMNDPYREKVRKQGAGGKAAKQRRR